MATTATFSPIALTDTDWVLVADGAAYQHVGVQIGNAAFPIWIYVGATIADPTVDNIDAYIEIDRVKDRSFSVDLGTTDKVYARSSKGPANLRGFRKTV